MREAAESFTGGVVVDMATPMTPAGDLDLGGAVRLSRRAAAAGVSALVLAGGAGEGPSLEPDERLTLWETVAAAVGDRVALWGGVAGASSRAQAELARQAQQMGLYGLAVPWSGGATGAGTVRALAEVTARPLLVVLGEGVREACASDVAALELALSGRLWVAAGMDALASVLCETDGRARVLAQKAPGAIAAAALGGRGVMSAAANLVPESVVALWRASARGDGASAWAELRRVWPLCRAIDALGAPPVVKRRSRLVAIGPTLRLPLQPLEGAAGAEVEALLERLADTQPPAAALAG